MSGRTWIAGLVAGVVALGVGAGGAIAQTNPALVEEGTLEEGDQVLPSDNSLYDEFTFDAEAGQTVTITLESSEFNTYLALISPEGEVLGENDDITEGNNNSRLELTVGSSGTYTVIANGYDSESRGDYTLEVKVED